MVEPAFKGYVSAFGKLQKPFTGWLTLMVGSAPPVAVMLMVWAWAKPKPSSNSVIKVFCTVRFLSKIMMGATRWWPRLHYSERKLLTGFAIAAFIASTLTVSHAMARTARDAPQKTTQPT